MGIWLQGSYTRAPKEGKEKYCNISSFCLTAPGVNQEWLHQNQKASIDKKSLQSLESHKSNVLH